ncbi:MAG: DUF1559 domain-containing protein [Planctomycetes bacterium]|nr:DUF1559 domain-containing protein [Planctomycetota bacterium]
MIDTDLLIGIDLTWDETIYRTKIAPRLVSVTNQIKGKMAVFSSDFSWHALAAAGPKAAEGPGGMFPRGTADRKGNADRYGLAYPPSSRVSLFADLLPYLGRGGLEKSLRKDLAWYDPHNLPAPGNDRAGAWVPELLVPDYPQSAWRATSPLAPDHVLGATNYVAIAWRGLNIARENPNDPAFKTKVGITGYGWGSKPEEVTDGLSNTIYMMQTPPGLQQPWIAGGGATVRGLDEVDPMGTFKYPQRGRTKEGSYALMADGSVRFIPADIDPQVLLAMSTRAGGEALTGLNGAAPKVEPPKPAVEAKPDPVPKLEPKPAEPKKPEDKKPDAKPEDKKPVEPKKAEDKKEPDPKAKGADAAPAPKEK